jgi:hypothetical protein
LFLQNGIQGFKLPYHQSVSSGPGEPANEHLDAHRKLVFNFPAYATKEGAHRGVEQDFICDDRLEVRVLPEPLMPADNGTTPDPEQGRHVALREMSALAMGADVVW